MVRLLQVWKRPRVKLKLTLSSLQRARGHHFWPGKPKSLCLWVLFAVNIGSLKKIICSPQIHPSCCCPMHRRIPARKEEVYCLESENGNPLALHPTIFHPTSVNSHSAKIEACMIFRKSLRSSPDSSRMFTTSD